MSIIIKSLSLPTGEDELRLIVRSNGQVIITHRTWYEETEAVELPPHGRLVDADKMYNSYGLKDYTYIDHNCYVALDEFNRMVITAPTILEAEEGQE
jgi:hypothetical protein